MKEWTRYEKVFAYEAHAWMVNVDDVLVQRPQIGRTDLDPARVVQEWQVKRVAGTKHDSVDLFDHGSVR